LDVEKRKIGQLLLFNTPTPDSKHRRRRGREGGRNNEFTSSFSIFIIPNAFIPLAFSFSISLKKTQTQNPIFNSPSPYFVSFQKDAAL
jgi:hypothetical protein